MKKVLSKLVLSLVVAATLLTFGCNRGISKSEPDPPVSNCLQRYNELTREEFDSPQEALKEVNLFLLEYEKDSSCKSCCNKAKELKEEFEDMDVYFLDVENSNNPKDRYCKFLSMANSTPFSDSSFEAVKKTWKNYKQERKTHYLNERVDLIDGEDFKPYMLEYAKDLAKEELSGIVRLQKIDEAECDILGNPIPELKTIQVEGKTKKQYTCRVRVGTLGVFEKNKGHIDFDVTGILGVSSSGCDLEFLKGDFELVDPK